MKCWKQLWGVLLAMTTLAVTANFAQQARKNKYEVIVVSRFDAAPDVTLPLRYHTTLLKEVASALMGTGKVKFVIREGDPLKETDRPTLILKGTITRFYMGGARNAGISAHVKFIDEASNQVLFESDVAGKIHAFAEDYTMMGAIQKFAKEIVKIIEQKFL